MGTDQLDDGEETPTSGLPVSTPLDRRSVVRGGLGSVLAGSLAGCQSLLGSTDGEGDGEDDEGDTDEEQSEQNGTEQTEPGTDDEGDQSQTVVFEDDWEDGSLDGWTAYAEGGDAAFSVEPMSTPSGGSRVLRLVQSTGSGTELIAGTEAWFSGWDGEWALRTAVHTTTLDIEQDYQKFDIVPAYDPTTGDNFTLSFRLGFRDGDGNVRPTSFYGSDVTETETVRWQWEEDRWYSVEVTHDGSGTLRGTVWPSTSSKPSSPTVEATASLPSEGAWPLAVHLNGNSHAAFQFSHSSIRLSGEFDETNRN